jgi:hypothetical protein
MWRPLIDSLTCVLHLKPPPQPFLQLRAAGGLDWVWRVPTGTASDKSLQLPAATISSCMGVWPQQLKHDPLGRQETI